MKTRTFLWVVALGMMVSQAVLAGSLLPTIPKAKGEQCVEPTQDMRVNHMRYLLHQRDDTMHRGIRTKKHSLKECMECHVQPDSNGDYPSVENGDHFCANCHRYAAVHIDCFQCHLDKPEAAAASAASHEENPHGH